MRYTQWHTTALCSPTRSCLLTGRNHTRNSMACITEAATGFPNGSGTIPPENGMLSEILGERGWNTYMVGKWHLCPDRRDEPRLDPAELADRPRASSGSTGSWARRPTSGTRTWSTTTTRSTSRSPPRRATTSPMDLTDKAIEFIKDAKAIAPDKPFFLYYAPGAAHAPHHAPREWIERYAGQVRHGLRGDARADPGPAEGAGHRPGRHRAAAAQPDRHARQTRTGPDGKPFPPLDYTKPWDSLSADEKRLFARMAEVYAGFLSHADHQIGRLLDYLEETGQRDNTLVIVVSDNGASGEGGPDGSVNENKFFNGDPRRPAAPTWR